MFVSQSITMNTSRFITTSLLLTLALSANSCANSEQPEEQSQSEIEEVKPEQETTTMSEPKDVIIKAPDGLEISGRLYVASVEAPMILLCHQARYNKDEYKDIAPKLVALGYTCLAIDQRSGSDECGGMNETNKRAKSKGLSTDFIDAEQDIVAAIEHMAQHHEKPVIIWGSSYSSSLVLKLANQREDVSAVISFSPGEYFGNDINLTESVNGLDKPAFVTSSKAEANEALSRILAGINQESLTQFIPQSEGIHGSKALWPTDPNREEYWAAITAFLKTLE